MSPVVLCPVSAGSVLPLRSFIPALSDVSTLHKRTNAALASKRTEDGEIEAFHASRCAPERPSLTLDARSSVVCRVPETENHELQRFSAPEFRGPQRRRHARDAEQTRGAQRDQRASAL